MNGLALGRKTVRESQRIVRISVAAAPGSGRSGPTASDVHNSPTPRPENSEELDGDRDIATCELVRFNAYGRETGRCFLR